MLYVVASVAAALILPRLEHAYLPEQVSNISLDSVRQFFSAIASGMLAFTGVVFAIALMAVQFSASAYSPRLATMLVERPQLYHALGIFFATFTFALAALNWSGRDGAASAPRLTTLLVAVLMVVSMLAFARLIHSINELQIHHVLQAIGRKGRAVIEEMPIAEPDERQAAKGGLARLADPIMTLDYHGQPQVVAELDLRTLVSLASAADAVIVIDCAVGDTLMQGAALASVHGSAASVQEAPLRRAIRLGPVRTFEQDPRYALRLLVDVAIRALSPAVNDPTTAVQAIDQIEDLLRRLGVRWLEPGRVEDSQGVVRVIFPAPAWQDYLNLAFDEIRQYGASSLQVQRRLRAALGGLAEDLPPGERQAAVLSYLDHLDDGLDRAGFDALDHASGLVEDPQGLGSPRRRAGGG
jgi:uncharacterized membrane protein